MRRSDRDNHLADVTAEDEKKKRKEEKKNVSILN